MSWHCSPVLVEEYSEATCSDGKQSAQSNTTPTPDQYYWPDKTTEHSRLSRFGMTCELLTENRGEELLTLYLAGFHVKTSALQVKGHDLTENEADYGLSKQGSFAKLIPSTRMWKTAQQSLFEDLELSLETWPKWGSMLNGECFHAQMSGEFIYESAPGLSLPTTGANEGKGAARKRFIGSTDFRGAKMSEGLRTCETDPIYLNPLFAELVMMWPLGWTDLKPLETGRFADWLQQHSGS